VTGDLHTHLLAFASLLDTYQTELNGWRPDHARTTVEPTFRSGRVWSGGNPLLDLWPNGRPGHRMLGLLALERGLCAARDAALGVLSQVVEHPDLVVLLQLVKPLPDSAATWPRAYGVIQRPQAQMALSGFGVGDRGCVPFVEQAQDVFERVEGLWRTTDPLSPHHPVWHVQDVLDVHTHPVRAVRAASWRDAAFVDEALHWCLQPTCLRRVFDDGGQPAGDVHP